MTSSIRWEPIIPVGLLLVAALAVVTVLVVLEWRRRQRFKWIRIVCQVLAVASVVGMLLRPAISTSTTGQPILLLTEGFRVAQVDSLLQATPSLKLYRAPGAGNFRNAVAIESFRSVRYMHGDPMWIAGSGIPEYALADVPFNFEYLPASIPEGIIDINHTGNAVAERWNSLDGTYRNPSGTSRTLLLSGPGGVEDSMRLESSGDQRFSLSFFPKVPGKIVYKLIEKDAEGKTIGSSSLPVAVERERKLGIVLINDYPTFEQRYLKNFLASRAHKISVRNRVSRDRYNQEFINRARQSMERLTTTLLNNSDLLIIDQASFQSLSGGEKSSITQSMEKGLGVLMLAGEISKKGQPIIFQSMKGATDTVRFATTNGDAFTLPVAPIKPSGPITPWLVSSDGRILSGCLCTGSTRAGFQLLRETYQLGLQGKTEAYADIWSSVLERTARRAPMTFMMVMRTPFPWYSNEPVAFDVLSSGASPVAVFDNSELPLAEDMNVDELWHGRLWADGDRWHTVSLGSDSISFSFFDLPNDQWRSLRIARQIQSNRNHVPQVARLQEQQVATAGSWPLIFFLTFVLSSGFLWLAPKI